MELKWKTGNWKLELYFVMFYPRALRAYPPPRLVWCLGGLACAWLVSSPQSIWSEPAGKAGKRARGMGSSPQFISFTSTHLHWITYFTG